MAGRRSKRIFTEPERAQLLQRVGAWRQDCVGVQSRAPINEPLYRALSGLLTAIDGVAETITGDARHFHLRSHSSTEGFADRHRKTD